MNVIVNDSKSKGNDTHHGPRKFGIDLNWIFKLNADDLHKSSNRNHEHLQNFFRLSPEDLNKISNVNLKDLQNISRMLSKALPKVPVQVSVKLHNEYESNWIDQQKAYIRSAKICTKSSNRIQ